MQKLIFHVVLSLLVWDLVLIQNGAFGNQDSLKFEKEIQKTKDVIERYAREAMEETIKQYKSSLPRVGENVNIDEVAGLININGLYIHQWRVYSLRLDEPVEPELVDIELDMSRRQIKFIINAGNAQFKICNRRDSGLCRAHGSNNFALKFYKITLTVYASLNDGPVMKYDDVNGGAFCETTAAWIWNLDYTNQPNYIVINDNKFIEKVFENVFTNFTKMAKTVSNSKFQTENARISFPMEKLERPGQLIPSGVQTNFDGSQPLSEQPQKSSGPSRQPSSPSNPATSPSRGQITVNKQLLTSPSKPSKDETNPSKSEVPPSGSSEPNRVSVKGPSTNFFSDFYTSKLRNAFDRLSQNKVPGLNYKFQAVAPFSTVPAELKFSDGQIEDLDTVNVLVKDPVQKTEQRMYSTFSIPTAMLKYSVYAVYQSAGQDAGKALVEASGISGSFEIFRTKVENLTIDMDRKIDVKIEGFKNNKNAGFIRENYQTPLQDQFLKLVKAAIKEGIMQLENN